MGKCAGYPETNVKPRDNFQMILVCYDVSTFKHTSEVLLSLVREFNYTSLDRAFIDVGTIR